MRVTSIFNMKGGVGKSTTAYNLAAGLVKLHSQRVLLVDSDPQGNSSAALGLDIWEIQGQLRDVFQGSLTAKQAIVQTASGVDVIPSNILLAEDEIPISGRHGRELLLRKAIAPVLGDYDHILIDCPPNVGVFAINALMAAKYVLIPVDMAYFGLEGVRAIQRTLALVEQHLEHPIKIAGVLGTRFDGRNKLSNAVLDSLKAHFQEKLFETVIPETVKLREATGYGISIFEHDPKGAGAKAYHSLVDEFVARLV